MFSLFKKNKIKSFNYTPRYYNKNNTLNDSVNEKKKIIKGDLSSRWKKNIKTSNNKKSTIKFFLIIIALIFIAYKIILFE